MTPIEPSITPVNLPGNDKLFTPNALNQTAAALARTVNDLREALGVCPTCGTGALKQAVLDSVAEPERMSQIFEAAFGSVGWLGLTVETVAQQLIEALQAIETFQSEEPTVPVAGLSAIKALVVCKILIWGVDHCPMCKRKKWVQDSLRNGRAMTRAIELILF